MDAPSAASHSWEMDGVFWKGADEWGAMRDTRIDSLRGLGMLSVVTAHTVAPTWLWGVVSLEVVAVFYFVSGMVWNDAPLAVVARKRIRQLYLPFVAWNLAALALTNVLTRLGLQARYLSLSGTASQAVAIVTLRAVEPLTGPLWFLAALLVTAVLFAALPKRVRVPGVLACVAVGCLNRLPWPVGVNSALVGVGVFYLGTQYRKLPDKWWCALLALVVAVLGKNTVSMTANT